MLEGQDCKMNALLTLSILLFTLIAWLGLYLLARDIGDLRLRWTGLGLCIYALLLASQIVLHGPYLWLLFGVGIVLLGVDMVMARQGVIHLGEAFWPDFLRSLDASILFALLFGTPVALTMLLATGSTKSMLVLLLITMTLALASQVFAAWVQQQLDRLAFTAFPRLQQQRAELRATVDALPKIDETVNPNTWNETEFVRLTRRALSHYGDLPRLSTSPLTRLPTIDARLAARQAPENTLERAAELKCLLQEAICRLKPSGDEPFNTSEAWRHYNALYFPYVVGLKPYSRRADHTSLDPTQQQALDWLRTQVPERTLHNWQNSAAKLVAQYLRESEK